MSQSPLPLVFDIDGVLHRLQGDREFLALLLDTFLPDFTDRLAKMQAALGEGRLDDLARLAHSLKGASATIGASRLHHRAAALDQACRNEDMATARLEWLGLLEDAEATRASITAWLAANRT
ncbi:Hpt domain-containing protein [Nitratidesulfovibrio sp.]|uniref:Hpt domain-containing protein n=1 Tax=Nitratidesulfovibrio sp. TaxID=2802297 RepID=UPI0033424CE9